MARAPVVLVLDDGSYPDRLWRFLLGIVRGEARMLAYLASLVDRYPRSRLRQGRCLRRRLPARRNR